MKRDLLFLVFLLLVLFGGINQLIFADGMEYGTNRNGKDYKKLDLSSANPVLCKEACLNDPICKSFTYVKPGIQGPVARCWLKYSIPPATKHEGYVSGVKSVAAEPIKKEMEAETVTVKMSALEYDINRKGMDLRQFKLNTAKPVLCQEACKLEPGCKSFTYVMPGIQGPKARCWLKHSIPPPLKSKGRISGVKE